MNDPIVVNRPDLQTVYEYARQFDVDDDPAMVRVREALGGCDDTVGSEVAQVRRGLDQPDTQGGTRHTG